MRARLCVCAMLQLMLQSKTIRPQISTTVLLLNWISLIKNMIGGVLEIMYSVKGGKFHNAY